MYLCAIISLISRQSAFSCVQEIVMMIESQLMAVYRHFYSVIFIFYISLSPPHDSNLLYYWHHHCNNHIVWMMIHSYLSPHYRAYLWFGSAHKGYRTSKDILNDRIFSITLDCTDCTLIIINLLRNIWRIINIMQLI